MCGRYASTRSALDLAALFEALDETEGELVPSYNVAPTDLAPIVRLSERAGGAVLSVARWGLVPPWARDRSSAGRMINARAETITTSRAFARPFAARRCLVAADGWFEWARGDPGIRNGLAKQPYFMTRGDTAVLAFGGIWSVSSAPGGRVLTYSIITVPATDGLDRIHDRMPLIIEPARWSDWLHTSDPVPLLGAVSPAYLGGLQLRPVSSAVGDVRNNGPQLVRETTPQHSTMECKPETEPTLF